MKTLKFTLANLFLWATLAVGCFYVENLAILTPDMFGGFDLCSFIILSIACFSCLIMYLILEHKRNGLRVDKVLLPIIIVLTFIMLLTLWAQGDVTYEWANGNGENVVVFTLTEKIEYSVMLVFVMAFTYINLYVMFAHRPSNRTLLWLPVAYLVYTFGVIIYSFITEADAYVSTVRGVTKDVQAFYHNTNTFAATMFLGVLSCFVINYYKPNVFTFFCIGFFFVMSLFTSCATTTIIQIVIIPIYFIIEIIRGVKRNLFRTVVVTGICLLIFAFGFLMYYAASQTDNKTIADINSSISRLLGTFKSEKLSGRTDNWNEILKYSFDSPTHMMFGHGFMISQKYIRSMLSALHSSDLGGSSMGENGFVYMTYSTGLIGLFLYIGILGYFGYSCIRLLLEKRWAFVSIYALCTISLVAYNFLEANLFFDMGIKETYMTIVFFMPPIVANKFLIHKKEVDETLSMKIIKIKFDSAKVGQIASIIFLVLMGAIATTFTNTYAINNESYRQMMVYVLLGLAGALLLFPYLIYLWMKNDSGIQNLAHVVVNSLGFLLLFYITFKTLGTMYSLIITGGSLLIDLVIYALIRKDYFRKYLSITFMEPIKIIILPLVAGMLVSSFVVFLTQSLNTATALLCLNQIILALVFFAIALFIIPGRSKEKLFAYLNNNVLYNYKTYLERGQ